jgi:PadR family transcriptional regulator, regulatory protein PadR
MEAVLRTNSGEGLRAETWSLYAALHRLDRQCAVCCEWKQTESNQRARFYGITAAGKRQLASGLGHWQRIVKAMASIIDHEPEGDEA